jgi:hypothetical protein
MDMERVKSYSILHTVLSPLCPVALYNLLIILLLWELIQILFWICSNFFQFTWSDTFYQNMKDAHRF